MRIAALYDIHGNLPALDAVLAEVEREGVDLIVAGGDIVPGPLPRETLSRLLGLSIPTRFILGNGEVAVLEAMAGKDPNGPAIRWNAEQLAAEREILSSWPATIRIHVAEIGNVLFCHGTPRHQAEVVTRLTPERPLLSIFAGLGSAMVVCGHLHMQYDRMVGDTRVVNAGSVGLPYGTQEACWLLIGGEPEFRRTPYDVTSAVEQIRETGYPDAPAFISQILAPPSLSPMAYSEPRA